MRHLLRCFSKGFEAHFSGILKLSDRFGSVACLIVMYGGLECHISNFSCSASEFGFPAAQLAFLLPQIMNFF